MCWIAQWPILRKIVQELELSLCWTCFHLKIIQKKDRGNNRNFPEQFKQRQYKSSQIKNSLLSAHVLNSTVVNFKKNSPRTRIKFVLNMFSPQNYSKERPEATMGTFYNNSNSGNIKGLKLKIVSWAHMCWIAEWSILRKIV